MYEPTWPFLFMYESHDMRHIGFCNLTVVNETPGFGASHKDWRDVPIQLKEKLWDSIEVTYLYSKRLLLTYYYSLKDKNTNNFVIICRLLLHWIKEVGENVCE